MAEEIDDEEDLVGSPDRTRKRTRDDILNDLTSTRRMTRGQTSPLVEDMMAGVTVSWLSQVFGMDPKTVKAKLADCPPLHRRKAGYVYHLPTACRYLIPPAISAEQYIKTMKPSDLPTAFQQSFWDAALKRQKWEENAGQLWRTDKVREVLGSTFQTIKFTIQLWADTVERQTELSPDQRATIIRMADALQSEIYDSLVRQAEEGSTGSQLDEMPDHVGESAAVISTVALVESEEDEIAGLI